MCQYTTSCVDIRLVLGEDGIWKARLRHLIQPEKLFCNYGMKIATAWLQRLTTQLIKSLQMRHFIFFYKLAFWAASLALIFSSFAIRATDLFPINWPPQWRRIWEKTQADRLTGSSPLMIPWPWRRTNSQKRVVGNGTSGKQNRAILVNERTSSKRSL